MSETEREDTGVPVEPSPPPDEVAGQSVGDVRKDDETASSGGNAVVAFNEFIQIRCGRRLPHFDSGPVKAYEAVGSGKFAGLYFALVCERNFIPRANAGSIFSAFNNPALVRLAASGVVDWTPARQQRYVLIYESCPGKAILKAGDRQAIGWKPEIVMEAVVKPLVSVLRDFRDKDFVHGAICPQNLFSASRNAPERIILGECLAGPPSFWQTALYEPVERAMADPLARGLGTRADDMYAFGVTLAVLLRHHDPLDGLTEKEIIKQKVENGSYAAITGKDRFTGAILELLRGLLVDDAVLRWSIDEVETWLDGQRLSPKQTTKRHKAARPISFHGRRYSQPAILAMDLEENVAEAVELVESGTLEQWLARSLEIKDADELIEKAVSSAEELGRGPGYRDRLVCRLSILLDPDAPIRLKGMHMRPDGVGNMLAEAIRKKRDLQPFVDMISDQTIINWLDSQKGGSIDYGAIVSRYETARAFVKLKNIGHGIERSVYILHAECPCLSEKLENYYVRTPEDIMYAFEDICSKGDAPVRFLDRHVAAFLSVKDRKNIDPYLVEINAEERHRQVLGELKTLATIQIRSRMEKFPSIARALASSLDPVYERFHDRELRQSLRQKIDRLKDQGDLSKIANTIDEGALFPQDFRAFRNAMIEYKDLRAEKEKLARKLAESGEFGRSTGHQVAALFSGILGGIIIVLFAIMVFAR